MVVGAELQSNDALGWPMVRNGRIFLMVALCSLLLLAIGQTVVAAPVFSVDFNHMSIGSPPSTDQPVIEPSGFFAQTLTTCKVQQSYGDIQDKPLAFSDSSAAAAAKVWFDFDTPLSQGLVSVTWTSAAGQVARGGEVTLWGLGGGILWMRYDQTGKFYVDYGDGAGHETGSLVGAYSVGVANTFRIDLDLGTRLFSLAIDGVVVISYAPTMPSDVSLQTVMFGTETSEPDPGRSENFYAVDNLMIEVAPIAVDRVPWGHLKRLYL